MKHDVVRWHCRWELRKWHGRGAHEATAAPPAEVVAGEGNLLTTGGASALWAALTGGAGTAFSSANAHLGVGDSSAAESAAQTDLQAATNKQRKGMQPGYPALNGNQVTFRSLFGQSDANFSWNEWGLFNSAGGGTMLNRKVQSLGTKTSSATWQFTVTLSLT